MKKLVSLLILSLSFALATVDAEAARRFGGGGNLGKQRPAPTMREAPKEAPAAPSQAAKPGQPAPAPTATPAPVPPKPGFMSRFGGLIAGLGIGALLGSLFGGGAFGNAMGGILMLLLFAGLLFLVFRMIAARRSPPPAFEGPAARSSFEPDAASPRPVFNGIGSAVPQGAAAVPGSRTFESGFSSPLPPDFNREAFLRVAKTSFIRLQAANDAKDLDDIRDYTTPEMYAEISMQLQDRGNDTQKTEIVSVDAQLADYALEGDYEIASVRFFGLIREVPGANPEPFDELWHVRKKANDARASWLIAGIQQVS
jgi:predicted lipid-binding transport protein (Tim44 family)